MKLGFVDYYIDNYHSNNYPTWMGNALGDEKLELYVWAEIDSTLENGLTTDEWCKKNNATRLSSIEEVCETVDYIVLLAPNNPERHLDYAKIILPYKKPTYIDKTFAPDYETAKQIVDLAEKYGTPFFSSSALRYADEYRDLWGKAESALAEGNGSTIDVYVIHPVEMVACLMGKGASKIMSNGNREQTFITIQYSDGRSAFVHYLNKCGMPYTASMSVDGRTMRRVVQSQFFQNLATGIIEFFKDEKHIPPIKAEDVLEGMRIRDGVFETLDKPYEWIELK